MLFQSCGCLIYGFRVHCNLMTDCDLHQIRFWLDIRHLQFTIKNRDKILVATKSCPGFCAYLKFSRLHLELGTIKFRTTPFSLDYTLFSFFIQNTISTSIKKRLSLKYNISCPASPPKIVPCHATVRIQRFHHTQPAAGR